MIKVAPDSELGRLLAQSDTNLLLVESEGVRYAIYRTDSAERSGARVGITHDGEQIGPTAIRSRLADGYQSIPALREPKTWKEIEEIVRDERAAHHAGKGM